MSYRIRYRDLPDNIKESNQVVSSSTKATYKVRLNLNDMSYVIKNVYSQHLIHSDCSKINNLNVLKRNARKHLERLGVKLTREIRNRSFGICEKGHNQTKEMENSKIFITKE